MLPKGLGITELLQLSISRGTSLPAVTGLLLGAARRAGRCVVAPLVGLGVALLVAAPANGAAASTPSAVARPVSLTVDRAHERTTVPTDFLGLSLEVKHLALTGSYASRGNLPGLLRSLSGGLVRFGGVTADTQVAWVGDSGTLPPWASTGLSPADFTGVARLARETRWRVQLALNLGHYDPQAAASEVSAAYAALGDNLAGVQFGNEPDALLRPDHLRTDPWTYAQYAPQAGAYRAAVQQAVPEIPIEGPDVSSGLSHLDWLRMLAALDPPALLTAHYYSLSCMDQPTIAKLIAPRIRAAAGRSLRRLGAIARAHHLPVRVDETNNISCGGKAGVSNTFASALWATDYATQAMSSGVSGLNFHGNVATPTGYSPLVALTPSDKIAGRLNPQAEWYALLLAHQLVGSRPLPVRARPGGLNLSYSAFAAPRKRLQLVVVNEEVAGSRPVMVHLPVGPDLTSGSVLRLSAPSLASTTGVRLGQTAVAADGSWRPSRRLPPVHVAKGTASFLIPPSSAALVTLAPHR